MYSRLGNLADEVTKRLNPPKTLYKVQVGAYAIYSNATNMLKKVKKDGYSDAFITKVGNLYKVQVGAYAVKANAENMLYKIKKDGYSDAFIAEVKQEV